MTNDDRYDKLTPMPVPEIPPVEIVSILSVSAKNSFLHLDCEVKDRPIEESLILIIPWRQFASIYEYITNEASNAHSDVKCRACAHFIEQHNDPDGAGCAGISGYEQETNSWERCHCNEFS